MKTEFQIKEFEEGIQCIVREIVAMQGLETPIVCVQGNRNTGKTELNNRLHAQLKKDYNLVGFSGKINHVERYRQEIKDGRTVFRDPRFYLIEELVTPATFVAIYRQFQRLPDIGVQLIRELPCTDRIHHELDYFHNVMRKACFTVKQPAFDLFLYNPKARDK